MKPKKLVITLGCIIFTGISTINAQKANSTQSNKNIGAKQTSTQKSVSANSADDELVVPLTGADDELLVDLVPKLPDVDLLVPLTKETKPTITHTNEQIRELMKKYWHPIDDYLDQRKKQFKTIEKYVVKKRNIFFAETDFIGAFEKVPLPAASMGTTLSAYCNTDNPFEAYSRNLQTMEKRFSEKIQAHSEYVKLVNKGQAAIEKEAFKQAQQNPILEGIDVEKLAKMSEAERAKYAEQVKKQMMANASKIQNQGMNNDPEMMAIMMNSQLSQSQKEAAVKTLMAKRVQENNSKTSTPKTEKEMIAENAGFENTLKEINAGKFQQQVLMLIASTSKSLGRAEERFNTTMNAIKEAEDNFSKKMAKWYKAAYDALPITIVGENAEKDPTQLNATHKRIFQEFVDRMLPIKAKAVEQFTVEAKYAVGRFHDFMADFKPDQHTASNPFNDLVIQVGQGGGLILARAAKIAEESAKVASFGCEQGVYYLKNDDGSCKCLPKSKR